MQTFEVEIKLIVHVQRAGDAASPAERRSVNGPLRVPPKVFRVRGNVLTYVSCRRGVGLGLSVIKHCQMLPSHRHTGAVSLIKLRWHRGKPSLTRCLLWTAFFLSASQPGFWAGEHLMIEPEPDPSKIKFYSQFCWHQQQRIGNFVDRFFVQK